jgi:hypothetical protein
LCNTLFGTPGGTQQQQNFTMPENHNAEVVIEACLEDLDEEQRKLVEANRDALTKLCLDSFSKTRGKVIQKSQLSTLSVALLLEFLSTWLTQSYITR